MGLRRRRERKKSRELILGNHNQKHPQLGEEKDIHVQEGQGTQRKST